MTSCWLIERELDNCIFLNCDTTTSTDRRCGDPATSTFLYVGTRINQYATQVRQNYRALCGGWVGHGPTKISLGWATMQLVQIVITDPADIWYFLGRKNIINIYVGKVGLL